MQGRSRGVPFLTALERYIMTASSPRSAAALADPAIHVAPGPRGMPAPRGTDFGVAGVLRVLTQGDGSVDRAAVGRDVGRTDAVRDREPDVTIRFVDQISPSGIRGLAGGWAAYDDDGVYLLDPSTRQPLAKVSQGDRWGQAQILCRRGLARVPFLSTAVDLAALFHQWAPVHGSGWVTPEGKGVLVAGWAHSGKTGALLSACDGGAALIGDDRILLSRSGSRMMGMGRPVAVKDWHMAQLRLGCIGRRPILRALARVTPWLGSSSDQTARGPWTRLATRAVGRARRALEVEVPCDRFANPPKDARLDVLILLETHRLPSIVAEGVAPGSTARRLAAQTERELLVALGDQLAFKYAFPDAGWNEVERCIADARSILEDATLGIPSFRVRHPYPCSLRELATAINGVVAEV